MSNQPLQIIQITDSHIFGDPQGTLLGLNVRISFEAVLSHLQENLSGVDAIFLTGDISQDLSPASYEYVSDQLEKLKVPIYVVPGNHDSGLEMKKSMRAPNIYHEKLVTLKNWRFIILDSNIPGVDKGNLRPSEMEFLARSLKEDESHPTAVVFHHNPFPLGSPWLDTMTIDNGNHLIDLLKPLTQVRCVIFGHTHQAHQSERHGIRYFGCPSTCVQFKPGTPTFTVDPISPGYRWFSFYPDGKIETEIRRLLAIPEGLNTTATGY
jgi:Icc protein